MCLCLLSDCVVGGGGGVCFPSLAYVVGLVACHASRVLRIAY